MYHHVQATVAPGRQVNAAGHPGAAQGRHRHRQGALLWPAALICMITRNFTPPNSRANVSVSSPATLPARILGFRASSFLCILQNRLHVFLRCHVVHAQQQNASSKLKLKFACSACSYSLQFKFTQSRTAQCESRQVLASVWTVFKYACIASSGLHPSAAGLD